VRFAGRGLAVPLTSLRRSPLVDLAVSQLREQVLSGQWPVGSRLPAETELAQRLEVGRSTIREAIRALVHAGLLETRQGSGTYVRSVTPGADWEPRLRRAAVLEVYEVREALEVQAARLAASRRTEADIAALRAGLTERQRARGEVASFVEADLDFHRSVVAAAHNPLLAEMFDSFAAVLREALIAVRSDHQVRDAGADAAHARLTAAIEAGDAAAAAAATHDHIDPTAANLRSLIGW
jgi:GntR family transcriptional regulator, transcriptional repressor for pyruvate dehydrogenase complex